MHPYSDIQVTPLESPVGWRKHACHGAWGIMSQVIEHRNQDATCFCGNLDDAVTEELLWELMLQAGPVTSVHMPKDKVLGTHQGFGFVEFHAEADAEYAIKIMNMVRLFQKPIRVNKSQQAEQAKEMEIGANLFIGNLAPEVDEKLLYDTFSAFGGIRMTPRVQRDMDTGETKGFGFVKYHTFEAADLAVESMCGQFLCGRAVVVQFAFKRNTTCGERHGSAAERLLAAKATAAAGGAGGSGANGGEIRPHTMFASAPGQSQQQQQQQQRRGPPMGMGMGMGMARPPPVPAHLAPGRGFAMAPPPPPPQMMMGGRMGVQAGGPWMGGRGPPPPPPMGMMHGNNGGPWMGGRGPPPPPPMGMPFNGGRGFPRPPPMGMPYGGGPPP